MAEEKENKGIWRPLLFIVLILFFISIIFYTSYNNPWEEETICTQQEIVFTWDEKNDLCPFTDYCVDSGFKKTDLWKCKCPETDNIIWVYCKKRIDVENYNGGLDEIKDFIDEHNATIDIA